MSTGDARGRGLDGRGAGVCAGPGDVVGHGRGDRVLADALVAGATVWAVAESPGELVGGAALAGEALAVAEVPGH